METRFVSALCKGDAATAGAALAETVMKSLETAPTIALVFGSTAQPLEGLLRAVHAKLPGTLVIGASSAGEFTQSGNDKGSASIAAIAGDFGVSAGIGTGLGADPEKAVQAALAKLPPRDAARPHRTAIVLVDPLVGRSEEAALLASAILGPDVRIAGGAAGDDLSMKRTYVGAGTQAASDAVVVAVIDSASPLGIGVAHGHRALSGPMKVTSAKDNTVRTVDGRPAWDVWADATREVSPIDPRQIDEKDIGAFLLRYEAGLATGNELKIRAPLSRTADGGLVFACGMPEGTVFRVTKSEPKWQIDAAKLAAERARAQLGGREVAGAVVFDCICRDLILGVDFSGALRAMSAALGGAPLGGFETYGEIALADGELSGFHNTTSVVLAFPK